MRRRNRKVERVREQLRRRSQTQRPSVVYFPIFVGPTGYKMLPSAFPQAVYESRAKAVRAADCALLPGRGYVATVLVLDVEYNQR